MQLGPGTPTAGVADVGAVLAHDGVLHRDPQLHTGPPAPGVFPGPVLGLQDFQDVIDEAQGFTGTGGLPDPAFCSSILASLEPKYGSVLKRTQRPAMPEGLRHVYVTHHNL